MTDDKEYLDYLEREKKEAHMSIYDDYLEGGNEMSKYKLGIWTPSAVVTCYECHGNSFPDTKRLGDGTYDFGTRSYGSKTWEKFTDLHELEEGKAVTNCDKCGCEIQLYEQVAMEHALMLELRSKGINACMMQTGGMNSAVQVYFAGNYTEEQLSNDQVPHIYVTYDWDGENDWAVGCYDAEHDYVEDDKVNLYTKDRDELVKHLLQLDLEKIREDFNNVNGPQA